MDFYIRKKWIYKKNDSLTFLKKNDSLSKINPLALEILANRGFDSPEKIDKFLNNSLIDLYDTRLLQDASKAIDIIINCLNNNEKIIIYSDFDADGWGCAVLCIKLLRKLGANVDYYINNRFIDGYGICKNGIDNILSKHPDTKLIITTDNGIVGYDGINYAKEKNLKVIVTDHHEPGKILPNADAVIDPKRKDSKYPFKELCGTGVVFKLMLLLYWELNKPLENVYDTLDIVAVSTIGDIVPLVDENRILVKEGLKLIKSEKHIHFKVFREITEASDINSHFTIGFLYVPMINALGRLDGTPNVAIDAFLSEDEDFIKESLTYMRDKNNLRKEMTEIQMNIAEELLSKKGLKNVIVLKHKEFHEGIIGLIAGRLKEKYNRPVIIFTEHNNSLKGSGRSVDAFHLKKAFDDVQHLLLGYGGHAKAGGLSIKDDNFNLFDNALNELSCKYITQEDLNIVKLNTDAVIDASSVNIDIIDILKELEPFGEGFPKPLLGIKNFTTLKPPFYMGENKNHFKLTGNNISIIGWNESEKYKKLGEPNSIKALGFPSINSYKNKLFLQFIIKDDAFVKA